MKIAPVVLLLLVACASAPAPQSADADAAAAEVRQHFLAGIEAFNRHDLDTFLRQFADDMNMYAAFEWVRGGEAIRKRFVDTFARFPNVRMEITDLQTREVAPGVVTVDFQFHTYPKGSGPAWHGVGSGVYVKRGNRWVEVLEHETVTKADPGAR